MPARIPSTLRGTYLMKVRRLLQSRVGEKVFMLYHSAATLNKNNDESNALLTNKSIKMCVYKQCCCGFTCGQAPGIVQPTNHQVAGGSPSRGARNLTKLIARRRPRFQF